MAHKMIEAFFEGKEIQTEDNLGYKIRLLKKGGEILGWRNHNIELNYEGRTKWIMELLVKPDKFKLYQEPEKAWIDTSKFLVECRVIEDEELHTEGQGDGAIVLAREFLKRADELYLHLKQEHAYKILVDLVGKEKLE